MRSYFGQIDEDTKVIGEENVRSRGEKFQETR